MTKTMMAVSGALIFSASQAVMAGQEEVSYAGKLWSAMEKNNLVGANAIVSVPYTGVHPHGAILDTLDATTTVEGESGVVLIKRNYGGEGVSKQAVANSPAKWLKAVTVMYKREGYDPETKDWFWVKYSPGGEVLKNPKGMPLAGKVGKGANAGCIACHKAAPGGDLVFNNDRYK
ncbi:MAG: cytochrome P460 family protein [Gammaproteobacteria bacterium]|nr:cytochrome P460 family protein [Gammaproteobacteria bacterium]